MEYSIAIVGLDSEDFIDELILDINQFKDKIKLNSISDQDETKLLQYQKKLNIKKLYTDFKDHILTESPDILIISFKPENVLKIILYAVEQNIKGIILNRPISSSMETTQRIVDLCKLNNINLIINYKKRWDPLYLNIKNIIKTRYLGDLISITGNMGIFSAKKGNYQNLIDTYGGGELLYGGSDLIDIIRMLAGEVVSINGFIKRASPDYGTETSAYGMLNMNSNTVVHLNVSALSKYDVFQIDLMFSKGRIIAGKNIKKCYALIDNADLGTYNELIKTDFPQTIEADKYNSGAISEMIYSLENRSYPVSSGFNALKSIEIAYGIYYSAYLSGNTISLPLKIAGNPLKKMFLSDML